MSLRAMISSAAFTAFVLAGMATARPAQAELGRFDERNYTRCVEDAAADAAGSPAGAGRDAVHEAARKACYQKFFLDRLGIRR